MRFLRRPAERWLAEMLLPLLVLMLLVGGRGAHADEDFLDPEVAFPLSARTVEGDKVELTFTPARGYYLYREQFKFEAPAGTTLGVPSVPAGQVHFDETFQKNVETYHVPVRITIPVERAPARFRLLVTSQGCADKGLCYPPMQRGVDVALTAFGGNGAARPLSAAETASGLSVGGAAGQGAAGASTSPAATAVPGTAAAALAAGANSAPAPDGAAPPGATGIGAPALSAAGNEQLDRALRDGRFWPVVGVFLFAGVLLSLTPCVLPMLPILSSIIVGQGARVSRGRGFGLALSYSLGMALVYTALGIAAGLAGAGLAAALQNPWVLGAFALGLVVLSLSMFGVYELQLPAAFSQRMTGASQRLPGGRFVPVFVMGGLSALIVSPCVAAPLAGALVYLSRSGDVLLGGSALFSLAAGMSVPLLLVGASAGTLLPRAGAWMDEVKRFFGLLLLGVALWMLQSVLPAGLSLALWGALLLSAAVLLASASAHAGAKAWTRSLWRRCAAAVLGAVGLAQIAGALSGGSDPLQPLSHLARREASAGPVASAALPFAPLRTVAELDAALRTGRPVMLDFYADWCVSCKEMERFTFNDPAVQKRLLGALLLRADVTANNADDQALLKRFGLFGPPGTIFFDANGRELPNTRVVGFQNTDQFLRTLQAAAL